MRLTNSIVLIKSLHIKSGVTWYFQFVFAASAAAKPFPSHVKTVSAKPLIYGTKNIWVWGNVPFHDLDPRSRLWCRLAKICLYARYVCGYVVLVMVIRFWRNSVENCYFSKFTLKNSDVFFKVKHYFGHISGMLGPIDVKRKESALVWYWVQYVTLTFDLTHDLDLGCFKVKFRNSSISGIVGLIDVKWKGSELIWYWANCVTLPFDHTHDLDLGVSRSETEIALSQECGGRLTMDKTDVIRPFMTMILTCVTMVGWADVPDSDRGDFRRRRAVDISSCSWSISCVYTTNVMCNDDIA